MKKAIVATRSKFYSDCFSWEFQESIAMYIFQHKSFSYIMERHCQLKNTLTRFITMKDVLKIPFHLFITLLELPA